MERYDSQLRWTDCGTSPDPRVLMNKAYASYAYHCPQTLSLSDGSQAERLGETSERLLIRPEAGISYLMKRGGTSHVSCSQHRGGDPGSFFERNWSRDTESCFTDLGKCHFLSDSYCRKQGERLSRIQNIHVTSTMVQCKPAAMVKQTNASN